MVPCLADGPGPSPDTPVPSFSAPPWVGGTSRAYSGGSGVGLVRALIAGLGVGVGVTVGVGPLVWSLLSDL